MKLQTAAHLCQKVLSEMRQLLENGITSHHWQAQSVWQTKANSGGTALHQAAWVRAAISYPESQLEQVIPHNLVSFRLELLNIPVGPHKAPSQEVCFVCAQPEAEGPSQLWRVHQQVVRLLGGLQRQLCTTR